MIWDLFLIGYFFMGVALTAMASIGHKKLYGRSMHWSVKVTGMILWPLVLLFGRKN